MPEEHPPPQLKGSPSVRSAGDIVSRLVRAAEAAGASIPIGLRAWDGSSGGPQDGPVIVIRSPRAFRHLLRRPGELGLIRAFVTGDLDLDGDLQLALRQCREFVRQLRAASSSVSRSRTVTVIRPSS